MARADRSRRHVGLDVSAWMLRRARRRARRAGVRLPLLRGDALALPVRGGALDGATAHSVLYLLPDPVAALREVRRALRPGGALAVLEPRAGPPDARRALGASPHHAVAMAMWRGMSGLHRRFDEGSLPDLLRAAGFEGARAWPVLSGYGVMAAAARPG
jgi:SAM-dependent methyltransferase